MRTENNKISLPAGTGLISIALAGSEKFLKNEAVMQVFNQGFGMYCALRKDHEGNYDVSLVAIGRRRRAFFYN